MILGLYRTVTTLAGPLIRWHLARRRARGKEDAARFDERLGIAIVSRPAGKLVWIHAASVGESLSLLPLIDAIGDNHPDWSVLITTGTVTSAVLMRSRLPDGVIHQYVPVDRMAYVRRFLDHWKPDLALWAESEFWPNLVMETAARGVPMVLINGRISDRSFDRWQRFPGFIRTLLGGFSLCLGQTNEDARRLGVLGARRAECHGNLKNAAPPLPAKDADLAAFRQSIGDRPVWLAASTHAGEEALAGRVHAQLRGTHPGLLTLIVPRHPPRADAIDAELKQQGLTVARRSAGQPLGPDTDVYLADTIGEMGLFYRLSPIVFIGKSIEGHGGQNPVEPATIGCALIHGPHMDNFREVVGHLADADAAVAVSGGADLAEAVDSLLADPERCQRLADAARAVAAQESGALGSVLDALDPFFDPEAAHATA